jgi:hypothetical protein
LVKLARFKRFEFASRFSNFAKIPFGNYLRFPNSPVKLGSLQIPLGDKAVPRK